MRLGLVLTSMPGYSETFIRSLVEQLSDAGHQVILFIDGPDNASIGNAQVVSGYAKRNKIGGLLFIVQSLLLTLITKPTTLLSFYKLEKQTGKGFGGIFKRYVQNAHIIKVSCDKLHFGFTTLMLGRENVAKAKRIKSSVSMRGFDMYVYPVKNPGCYKLLFDRLDKVHSISEDLLKTAYKYGLNRMTATQVIPPAVKEDIIAKGQIHSPIKPEKGPLKLVTVGRTHWMKGGEDMLHALANLKRDGVEFTLKWIGDGPDMERLKFASLHLGLREQVSFVGKLDHNQTIEEVTNCHIYLQYSYKEGFCNAVLEAQALSKLCVVSNGGALAENVIHNETGWVVEERSSIHLQKQIAEIALKSHEELERVAKNGHQRVKKSFNCEVQRKEFIEFFEN